MTLNAKQIENKLKKLEEKWRNPETVDATELRLVQLILDNEVTTERLVQLARPMVKETRLRGLFKAFEDGELENDRFNLMWRLFKKSKYAEDLVATNADAEWLEDERFKNAYNAGKSISVWSSDIRWRAYVLMNSAERSAALEGDFVECGVDRGGTATCVINYLPPSTFSDRKFYLFDTFQGLSIQHLGKDELEMLPQIEGRYPNVLDEVRGNFSQYDFTRIVPGTVPETLPEFKGDKIAYLHIDMNAAYPEVAALEYFWPKLTIGAPVIFDDYGFPLHKTQRQSLDVLCQKLGTSILMLPTGQGMLWKTN